MKKSISIFFFAIYLLSTTQCGELLKLPILIEHYLEHKQEDKNLSFLDYLAIHYAHGNPHDADYEKDMKLPFKSINNSNLVSITFCNPILQFKGVLIVNYCENKKQFSDYSFTYSSAFLSAIWQPPKFC